MAASTHTARAGRRHSVAYEATDEGAPANFSVVQENPKSGAYCASRNLESFDPFPDTAVRANLSVHHWVDAQQINPISAVKWIWTAGWSVGPRRLNDSMWFWFDSVDGWARIDGERYILKPRTLLLIPRGVEHEIFHERGRAQLHAVHFQATVYGSVSILDLMGYPHKIDGRAHAKFFAGASQRLVHEFAIKSPGWTRAMSTSISDVLLQLLRFYSGSFRLHGTNEMQAELPRLLPALTWMHAHLSDPDARIADMAAAVHVCESQFRKLFTKSLGLSPVQFMQRQRVERASSLLSTTDSSIEQIAQDSGFSDVPFFYRTFKAWTEMSPGQYRSLVKSGQAR